jgi:hypothetical protein
MIETRHVVFHCGSRRTVNVGNSKASGRSQRACMLVYGSRHHVCCPTALPEMSAHPRARDGAIFREPKQCDAVRRVRSRLDAEFAAVHGDHGTHLLKVRRCVYASSGMVRRGSALRSL